MPARDPVMDGIVDELRARFHEALDLDVDGLRQRVQLLEGHNQQLRREVDELRRGLELVRAIASEHEARLRHVEGERTGATVLN